MKSRRNLWIITALLLTMLTGAALSGCGLLNAQGQAAPTPMPTALLASVLLLRLAIGSLSVWFYLRGGVLLAWWWGVLLHSRHLWTLR